MSDGTDEYLDRAVAAYRRRLRTLVADLGTPTEDPRAAGERAADYTAAGLAWADEIGPLTDTAGAREILGGVSRQAVGERVRGRRLLALRTSDSGGAARRVYPVWQFRPEIAEHLPAVLHAVGYDPDDLEHGWWIASWLCTSDPALGGMAPRELLATGEVDAVLAAAGDVRLELGVDEREVGRRSEAA